jgi:hypothetical protein
LSLHNPLYSLATNRKNLITVGPRMSNPFQIKS